MSTKDAIVSDFIVDTCRSNMQPNMNRFEAWYFSKLGVRFVTTGSVSELYIDPMLSFIGDVDIMFYSDNSLAVNSKLQEGQPLHLPSTFADNVNVYIMVDSPFHGYVQLNEQGELVKRIPEENEYTFVTSLHPKQILLVRPKISHIENYKQHGPAVSMESMMIDLYSNCWSRKMDHVPCVRNLSWPTHAADWPKRVRRYGWPDAATIDTIVSNGCDLVQAAHCQSLDNFLWRLSFSRAETLLLNTWTPTQQIVYHILRVVLKTSGLCELCDSNGHNILSIYHAKTLMLWSCERQHSSWWTNSNVISVTRCLMASLLKCFESRRCPGYFVRDANLCESGVSPPFIAQLKLFTDSPVLSEWIINNYIRTCVQSLCPDDIKRVFDDISTSRKLRFATNTVVQWRCQMAKLDSLHYTNSVIINIQSAVANTPVISLLRCNDLSKIDQRLYHLTVPLGYLKSLSSSNDDIINMLTAYLTSCCDLSNMRSLHNATCLIRLSSKRQYDTKHSILLILGHTHLCRALKTTDCPSESTHCLANVYLAVLYYITGQYQTAIKHCRQVTNTHIMHCSLNVLDGHCLLRINDNIDNVLGLVELYQFIRTSVFQEVQRQDNHSFHTKPFANCLVLLCTTQNVGSNQVTFHKLKKELVETVRNTSLLFVCDLVLCYILQSKKRHLIGKYSQETQSTKSPFLQFTYTELRHLLIKVSVDQMTLFHQIMARDYYDVGTIVTTDIQALYAYKCAYYQRCFDLSQQNVDAWCLTDKPSYFRLPICCMTPLIDEELASLSAVLWLKGDGLVVQQLSLSLHLLIKCKLQLKHPVPSLIDGLRLISLIALRYREYPAVCVNDRLLLAFCYRMTIVNIRRKLKYLP